MGAGEATCARNDAVNLVGQVAVVAVGAGRACHMVGMLGRVFGQLPVAVEAVLVAHGRWLQNARHAGLAVVVRVVAIETAWLVTLLVAVRFDKGAENHGDASRRTIGPYFHRGGGASRLEGELLEVGGEVVDAPFLAIARLIFAVNFRRGAANIGAVAPGTDTERFPFFDFVGVDDVGDGLAAQLAVGKGDDAVDVVGGKVVDVLTAGAVA